MAAADTPDETREGRLLRIGLLGAGRIGKMHAGVLTSIDQVDELLIADPVEAVAAAVATEVGARAASVETVLQEADAYVIAAASDAHAPLVRAGLERGVPIFCEKPLTPDLLDAIVLAEESRTRWHALPIGLPATFRRRLHRGASDGGQR